MGNVKWFLVLSAVGLVAGQTIVNTTSGYIRGIRVPVFQATQYLGIPYAESPVGELRFMPPVRKSRMGGVFNASSNDLICPQATHSENTSSVITEDCLRLDIYVPDIQSIGKLPVMLWIHGGWYLSGDTTSYNSLRLSLFGNVIVVAVNYRLGILGFLNTNDDISVGNIGLRDQCSAIGWVVDNIVKFGGDANQITIFGQGAGASSALQLSMSSLCVGKFQRVIAQSGSPSALWAYNKNPSKSVEKLALISSCPRDSTGLLNCLKKKSWQEIIKFQNTRYNLSATDWTPSYNGDVFPESPIEIIRGKDSPGLRRFRSLDLLTGVCNEEGEVPFLMEISKSNFNPFAINEPDARLTDTFFNKLLRQNLALFPGLDSYEMERFFPTVRSYVTDWKRPNEIFSNTRMLIRFYGDVLFNYPAIHLASLHSAKQQRTENISLRGSTYFYQFKHKGSWIKTYPWTVGSTHGEDVYFVFGFVSLIRSTSILEKSLSETMGNYWTNFAKSGSTNGPVVVNTKWPEYNTSAGKYIELDLGLSNSSISTYPYARRYAFWDELFLPEIQRMRTERQQIEAICGRNSKSSGSSVGQMSKTMHIFKMSGLVIFVVKIHYCLTSHPSNVI